MDKIASGIIDKLSIVGFFNVIISGAVILYGISPILDQYAPQIFFVRLGLNSDIERGIIICLLCYIIGCALQGMQETLFKGLKKHVVTNCLVSSEKTSEGVQARSVLGNTYKEQGVIKLAAQLFSIKNLGEFDPGNKEMCSYFVDYCEYSNSIKGYGSKASRQNESATFYEMLALAFYTLVVIGILIIVFVHTSEWPYCIFYLIMGFIFTGRAYQHRVNWLKAVLSTFEAAADKEASDIEQLNNLFIGDEAESAGK